MWLFQITSCHLWNEGYQELTPYQLFLVIACSDVWIKHCLFLCPLDYIHSVYEGSISDFNIADSVSKKGNFTITLNELPRELTWEQLHLPVVWEHFQLTSRQQFSKTFIRMMIVVWIILSSQIARTLQQVTKMYSYGWHRSLAVHIWLMSAADTTLFSVSRWFVIWYWKIFSRIKLYKLQNEVFKTYLCLSSVQVSLSTKSALYTMLLVKE